MWIQHFQWLRVVFLATNLIKSEQLQWLRIWFHENNWYTFACQQSWHKILRKPHKLCLFAKNTGMKPHMTYLLWMCMHAYIVAYINMNIEMYIYTEKLINRLAFGVQNSMKKVSVYKSLPEYSICWFRGIF